jgi:hypothetical protein
MILDGQKDQIDVLIEEAKATARAGARRGPVVIFLFFAGHSCVINNEFHMILPNKAPHEWVNLSRFC